MSHYLVGFIIGLAGGLPIGAALAMAFIALTTPKQDR